MKNIFTKKIVTTITTIATLLSIIFSLIFFYISNYKQDPEFMIINHDQLKLDCSSIIIVKAKNIEANKEKRLDIVIDGYPFYDIGLPKKKDNGFQLWEITFKDKHNSIINKILKKQSNEHLIEIRLSGDKYYSKAQKLIFLPEPKPITTLPESTQITTTVLDSNLITSTTYEQETITPTLKNPKPITSAISEQIGINTITHGIENIILNVNFKYEFKESQLIGILNWKTINSFTKYITNIYRNNELIGHSETNSYTDYIMLETYIKKEISYQVLIKEDNTPYISNKVIYPITIINDKISYEKIQLNKEVNKKNDMISLHKNNKGIMILKEKAIIYHGINDFNLCVDYLFLHEGSKIISFNGENKKGGDSAGNIFISVNNLRGKIEIINQGQNGIKGECHSETIKHKLEENENKLENEDVPNNENIFKKGLYFIGNKIKESPKKLYNFLFNKQKLKTEKKSNEKNETKCSDGGNGGNGGNITFYIFDSFKNYYITFSYNGGQGGIGYGNASNGRSGRIGNLIIKHNSITYAKRLHLQNKINELNIKINQLNIQKDKKSIILNKLYKCCKDWKNYKNEKPYKDFNPKIHISNKNSFNEIYEKTENYDDLKILMCLKENWNNYDYLDNLLRRIYDDVKIQKILKIQNENEHNMLLEKFIPVIFEDSGTGKTVWNSIPKKN